PLPHADLASLNQLAASRKGRGVTEPSETADRILAIARSWIGTPYVHQASLKGVGCDCLGLLRGIWRELYGEEPEEIPPYSLDWAEATGAETLYMALERHCREVSSESLRPGDIALFRMLPRGPAKHCGIVGSGAEGRLTLIHSRQNKRVSEEPFSAFWRDRLAFAFRPRG
ncbi:MAG TPA: hypothetical protein VIM02_07890, partial [Rhizomicrobium sp.]